MDSIMLPSSLDVSKITYGTPKSLDNGGKSIYISFDKRPIVLQTPEMFAPFGKSFYDPNKGKGKEGSTEVAQKIKYTLDLSFKGMETREQLKTFFDKLTEIDEKLIDDCQANSFEWLKKKNLTRETVSTNYTKLVRYSYDKEGELITKYAPNFKLTLPFKDGVFQCDVYDANKNLVDLNTIETKGARVTAIIQCLGIWVAAGKFGCTWKVLQMRVVPPQSIKGYAFKEIESAVEAEVDEEEEQEADSEELLQHAPVDVKSNDSDVIDSSDDDDLEVKKPEPSKAKKVTAVKKK